MFEKYRLALDKTLTMSNVHDKIFQVYGRRVSAYLDEGDDMRYRAFNGSVMTYELGFKFVNRVCNALKEIGVKKGDRVAICTSNKVDFPLIVFAAMRVGAVAVPLNYQLKQEELAYIIDNCGAKYFVVDREVFTRSVKDKKAIEGIESWVMSGPQEECLENFLSLDVLTAKVKDETEAADIDPREGVAIFYTSGTTGFPKGAMMSSNALLTGQKIATALLPTNASKDFGILALPISHIMGFCTSLMGMLSGVRGLFMSKFHPRRVLEAIQKYHGTFFVGVPAMYAMLLEEGIDKYDLSSMKAWCSAADAMPKEHIDIFRKKGGMIHLFGKPIGSALFVEAYGMVELAGIAMIKFDLPGINFAKGCVGIPVYPFKVKVMKPEGDRAKPNQVGDIWIKGPGVTNGYYNNPEASKELINDGWLNTGDLGKKNRLGLIYFVDRKKDVIKSGGYSIFSVEVEHKLLEHPKIARACVFGIDHPTKKEVPVAVVVLKEGESATEQEIYEWSRQHMANYKAPRSVKIVEEKDIPMGMTLKVLKKDLRVKYKDEFASRIEKTDHK